MKDNNVPLENEGKSVNIVWKMNRTAEKILSENVGNGKILGSIKHKLKYEQNRRKYCQKSAQGVNMGV